LRDFVSGQKSHAIDQGQICHGLIVRWQGTPSPSFGLKISFYWA
jgi:hypothetical protein